MKSISSILLTALALGSLSIIAMGEDAPTGPKPGGPGGRPVPPIIAALDANHDGVIDASEIANASAALKTLDKNGDGKLTADEIHPPHEGGPGGPGGGKHGDKKKEGAAAK